MKFITKLVTFSTLILLLFISNTQLNAQQTKTDSYQTLLQLCKELRLLERTSLPNGVPDYRSQTIIKTQQTLQQYKGRLQKIDGFVTLLFMPLFLMSKAIRRIMKDLPAIQPSTCGNTLFPCLLMMKKNRQHN